MTKLLSITDPRAGRWDMSSANLYGHITQIDGLSHDQISPFRTDEIIRIASEFIDRDGFDPEEDAFVMTGQTIVMSIVFGYLLARFGAVKVLLYNAAKHTYDMRRVSMPREIAELPEVPARFAPEGEDDE